MLTKLSRPNRLNQARCIALVALSLSLPVALLAQDDDPARQAIEKQFDKDKIPLRFEIQGDTATLSGKARNVFVKRRAIEILLEHEGIEGVEDEVEIAEAEDDNALGKEVIKKIRTYGNLSVFDDAGAVVKDGSVVLFGFVTEPFKKDRLGNRMQDVLGIKEFDNQIQVLPNSMQDNNLRRVVFRRLYTDSMFSDFASMSIPPIHIIVQNARVLLTGAVQNQMAKQRAEQIVRTTPGVLSVESRLRLGS